MSPSQARTTVLSDVEKPKALAIDRSALASMKKQAGNDILYRTAALAVFTVIVVGLLRSTIFFLPCMAAVVCLYAASVTKIVLAGKVSGPLYTSLRLLAATVFFTTFVMAPGLPATANGLGPSVFLLGLIWSVHFTAKAYAEIAGVATRSLLIAALGYLYCSLFSASGVSVLPQLSLIVLTGFAATAVFSFAGIVSRHSDARISAIGKAFTGQWSAAAAGTALAAIMTYLIFVRSSLMFLGPLWITLLEWAAICLVILWLFREIRSRLPRGAVPRFGDGHTVAGAICFEKGELDKTARMVEEFVTTGKKDGLVTLMMAALIKNDIPQETVQKVISVVIDYRESREPPVLFKWALGDLDEVTRRERMTAVNQMMTAALAAISSVNGPVTGTMKADQTGPGKFTG
jgi:hypothetical protein